MTSKKAKGSSIAALINQWASQQDRSSYRILLQHTTGIATRLQAANSLFKETSPSRQVGEETVYRRAGLRTPTESALRDLFGGVAWVQFLLEAGVENNLEVIFVRTLPRPTFVPAELLSKLKVMDASRDPWGWEEDVDENKSMSLQNLRGLLEALQSILNATDGKPAMLVWESLTPLIMVHGFDRLLRFLESLEQHVSRKDKDVRLLQIWPVRTETLTTSQHTRLEDASNALMYLNRGEMILMRQGIRESGNLVRELVPFRLIPQGDSKGGSLLSFRLEGGDDEDPIQRDTGTSSTLRDEKSSLDSVSLAGDDFKPQQSKPGRSRISLQLESDDAPTSRQSNAEAITSENRPRIYLQDNDPEFDDMDDEDPDDDLDI